MARIMLFYYTERHLGHRGIERHLERHLRIQTIAALRNQTRGLWTGRQHLPQDTVGRYVQATPEHCAGAYSNGIMPWLR
jgi:hypothetical protein